MRVRCSARVRQRSGQRLPLGVPGSGSPLVLLVERRREDRRVAAHELGRTRVRASTRPGCACAGSVEEPPSAPSRSSPTSVCARSTTSQADLRRAPLRSSRALRPARRSACGSYARAATGSTSPRSSASAAGPPALAPRSPRASRPLRRAARPAARVRTTRGCARDSSSATSQPAALNPNVVGTRLLQQRSRSHRRRPMRLGELRPARPRARRARPRIRSSARRATSMEAVSMTSWLVAPQWT